MFRKSRPGDAELAAGVVQAGGEGGRGGGAADAAAAGAVGAAAALRQGSQPRGHAPGRGQELAARQPLRQGLPDDRGLPHPLRPPPQSVQNALIAPFCWNDLSSAGCSIRENHTCSTPRGMNRYMMRHISAR